MNSPTKTASPRVFADFLAHFFGVIRDQGSDHCGILPTSLQQGNTKAFLYHTMIGSKRSPVHKIIL